MHSTAKNDDATGNTDPSFPKSAQPGTYVTFDLAGENLGVEVSHVREILDTVPLNRMPNASADMEGVVDIRGESIPIVDMGGKLGLPRKDDCEDTRIIVFEIRSGDDKRPIGVIADKVRDVTRISPEQIENPPKIAGSSWQSDLLLGLARHGDLFIMLLDVQRVFNADGQPEMLDPAFM